jgi:nucleoid-associated protein YgaU
MITITVSGGNLFQIAAQMLNDATQWNRIAKANGLTDPMIYGLITLVIPSQDSSAGGGIASQ